MSHHFQKGRIKNIESVKRMIAQAMPEGANDQKLRAVFAKRFSRIRIAEYLDVLQECGEIELIEGKWRLCV